MTIELKQEYQLQAGRITSSPGPTPRAASAVVSAAVPEVTRQRVLHLHPRGQRLLERRAPSSVAGARTVPAERLALLKHVAKLGKLLVVIVLGAVVGRAERPVADRLTSVGREQSDSIELDCARAAAAARNDRRRMAISSIDNSIRDFPDECPRLAEISCPADS